MRDRSYRRHERSKQIARVEHWLKQYRWFSDVVDENHDETRKAARKRHKHPQGCSGACCGNPRKWFGDITTQEKRAPRSDDW